MNILVEKYKILIDKINDLPFLAIRLTLSYGFFEPPKMKLSDINSIIEWYREIGMPATALNAYLAKGTEVLEIICLVLGLWIRYIIIPLIVTMIVAIKTVHLQNGFSASDNGFEIPFFYMLLLFTLLIFGADRLGLDHMVFKIKNKLN